MGNLQKLGEILDAFEVYRAATANRETRRNDQWCLRYIRAYLCEAQETDLRLVCLRFIGWLRQQPLSEASCATIAGRLYHALHWALDEGYLDRMPLKAKELPRHPDPTPEPLSPDELRLIFDHVVGRRWIQRRNQAILVALLETGCRVGELVQITRGAIDAGVAEVIQKGNRPHQLLLTHACLDAIHAYLDACPYRLAPTDLLWRTHDNRPMNALRVRETLEKIGRRAGIHLYPHRLRQTSATLRLAAGAPTEVVRRALGHSSEKALRHYVKLADSQQRALLEATSPMARVLGR